MIDEWIEILSEENDDRGAPWYGNPWYFDVRCANCQHEYPNSMTCCPACDHDEVTPVE